MRALFAIFGATILAAAACGARSELPVPEPRADAGVDAPDDVLDAGPDVVDAPEDAPPDVFDAPFDAPDECADAGTSFIYVVTSENILFRFYPPNATFVEIGPLGCPSAPDANPFSMAVDRKGIAYVLFQDSTGGGELFRLSTANPAQCQSTGFVMNQGGFSSTFGMGFSANADDPGETLYVASDTSAGSNTPESLATIDPATFNLNVVGQFSHVIGNAELTGTGDAKLYAFGVDNVNGVLHLAQVQKTDAQIVDDQFIDLGTQGATITAWAFAYWGGDFYFFTSTSFGTSKVSRYHPGDPAASDYATLGATIVGAGVSTCAPQQ